MRVSTEALSEHSQCRAVTVCCVSSKSYHADFLLEGASTSHKQAEEHVNPWAW